MSKFKNEKCCSWKIVETKTQKDILKNQNEKKVQAFT